MVNLQYYLEESIEPYTKQDLALVHTQQYIDHILDNPQAAIETVFELKKV